MDEKVNDTLLVGIDFSHGKDVGVLVVGRRVGKTTEIINMFQGPDAWDLYTRLLAKKEQVIGNE